MFCWVGEGVSYRFARSLESFASFKVDTFKVGNMKRHQDSTNHKTAVALFLRISADPIGVPAGEKFREAWEMLRKGNSGRSGKESVGSYSKFRRLLWCLSEAMRRIDRRFLLQDGVVVVLHRDERMSEEPATMPNCLLIFVFKPRVGEGCARCLQEVPQHGTCSLAPAAAQRVFGIRLGPLQKESQGVTALLCRQ